jgi:hypothetical protein
LNDAVRKVGDEILILDPATNAVSLFDAQGVWLGRYAHDY